MSRWSDSHGLNPSGNHPEPRRPGPLLLPHRGGFAAEGGAVLKIGQKNSAELTVLGGLSAVFIVRCVAASDVQQAAQEAGAVGIAVQVLPGKGVVLVHNWYLLPIHRCWFFFRWLYYTPPVHCLQAQLYAWSVVYLLNCWRTVCRGALRQLVLPKRLFSGLFAAFAARFPDVGPDAQRQRRCSAPLSGKDSSSWLKLC